ncbi:PRP38-domain-containing protein [Aureobasidium pullulans]|uniref:Pre-mRNA-splicing factor 38 n=1 Tax=Aureobasidium pullulans TaxID=5580 RepID=A0A4S9LJC0_AURPU|nr:PRP38-domain-containing protein [Aureobasidium pullulans]
MAHQADATRMLDDRGYTGTLIRGQNPLLLFEKAVRDRIIDSYYWKEQCFGLNAATLCDRAVELSFIGGTYGIGQKPTPFLCLAFKLLQLTPEKDIILHYLRQEEWKYLRALAAFYIRLTWEPKDIYETLEGYLSDYRKLKRRTRDGYQLSYIDQFVDDLLTKDRVCATSLWKMPSRTQLEDIDVLEPRVSALGDEIDELDKDDEDMKDGSDGEVEEEESAIKVEISLKRLNEMNTSLPPGFSSARDTPMTQKYCSFHYNYGTVTYLKPTLNAKNSATSCTISFFGFHNENRHQAFNAHQCTLREEASDKTSPLIDCFEGFFVTLGFATSDPPLLQ